MDTEILISIIIPTYNTQEEYLLNGIKSICNQLYDDIEMIIVDDGSPEKYRIWLDSLSYIDRRIKIIHKDHSGVSDTRNCGIKYSKGYYTTFVDADDQVKPYFLKNAIAKANKYNFPDIVIGGIEYKPYQKSNETQFGNNDDLYLKSDMIFLKKSMLHLHDSRVKYNILGSPCGRLYKTEFLKRNNILFPKGVALCEDQIFNREALLYAENAVVVPEMWYIYEQNDFSVMHTKVEQNLWGMKKKYWDELYKLDNKEDDELKDGIRGVYVRSFFSISSNYCRNKNLGTREKKDIVQEMLNHPLITTARNELNLKSKIPLSWKIQWLVLKLKFYRLINLLSHFVS